MPRGLNSLDWTDKAFQEELEEQIANGATAKALANKYGKGHVHFAAMLKMIGLGRNWRNQLRNDRIRETYNSGNMTQSELGKRWGITQSRVCQLTSIKERKAYRQRRVRELYLGDPNLHIDKIAESVGVKPSTIYSDLHELGLMI